MVPPQQRKDFWKRAGLLDDGLHDVRSSRSLEHNQKVAKIGKALKQVVSEETHLEMERLQKVLTDKNQSPDAATVAFNRMKEIASVEMQRLDELSKTCQEGVESLNTKHELMENFLDEVAKSFKDVTIRQPLLDGVCPDGCVDPTKEKAYQDRLFSLAQEGCKSLDKSMSKLIKTINSVSSPHKLGFSKEAFPLKLVNGKDKIKLDKCQVKSEKRLVEKITNEYMNKSGPRASHILDICRCRVTFRDAYTLLVFSILLGDALNVVRLKSFFGNDRSIKHALINVQLEQGLICEIQLSLDTFNVIHQENHIYYEIIRAENPAEVANIDFTTVKSEKTSKMAKKLDKAKKTDKRINGQSSKTLPKSSRAA